MTDKIAWVNTDQDPMTIGVDLQALGLVVNMSLEEAVRLKNALAVALRAAEIHINPPKDYGTSCGCHKCLEGVIDPNFGWPVTSMRMIVCPLCGNKRCPHASDHRNACTGSNEPGQPGSVY